MNAPHWNFCKTVPKCEEQCSRTPLAGHVFDLVPFVFFPWYIVQKWISVGMTLEQLVRDQLAAVDSQSQNTETSAYLLHLRGQFFRMLAVQEDPLYFCALWDCHKQVNNRSSPLWG